MNIYALQGEILGLRPTKIIKPLEINKPIEVAYPINSKNDITTILV